MMRIAAAVLAFAASLAGASPAQAYPGCVANRFCLHDTATEGPFFEVEPADTVLNQCVSVSSWTSNITNNTNYRFIVSTSTSCAANRGIIYPHSSGAMSAPWNNNIRGFYRTSMTSFDVGYPPAIISK